MSTAVSALPRCVALRSKLDDKSYLRSVHDENHGGGVIELGGSGDDGDGGIMNPRCRFYLEPSEKHEGLVHVRCCYNNKYWVPQQRVLPGGRARWVLATADEPEEDLSKPSCTLHKHIVIAGEEAEEEGYTGRFVHSKLGKYACATVSSTSVRSYMHIASDEDEADRQDGGGLIDGFTVIDVSNQKLLPSHLVFKGNNEEFLQGVVAYGRNWLQFQNGDIGDARVLHTIFTRNHDGVVRIKSNYFGRFWSLGEHWIWADSTDSTYNNRGTLFRVTTGEDFIALRNLGNNRFCRRFTTQGLTNVLTASVDSITQDARIQCYEPVVSREIYDIDFRLSEARKYTQHIGGLHSQTVTNRTSTTINTALTFNYTWTVETTWSSSVSLTLGIRTTLRSGVPFIVNSEIEISTEFSGSYTWGNTVTEQEQVTRHIEVHVAPMKRVTVNAIGSNGACDIPFSYTQRDTLLNGEVVTNRFHDGLYVGIRTSNVNFEPIEEDL